MGDRATVSDHIDSVAHPKRREDARKLVDVMERITGEEPRMWGSIVGFGQYHYRYASGREGDGPAAAFAPRKSATTVYVMDGVETYAGLLDRLGPHTTGVGCIYIKDVDAIDLGVLEEIVRRSYAALTAGTFTNRASDGGLRS